MANKGEAYCPVCFKSFGLIQDEVGTIGRHKTPRRHPEAIWDSWDKMGLTFCDYVGPPSVRTIGPVTAGEANPQELHNARG